MKKNKQVDVYIAKSADFSKPILRHLRALVEAACPEAEEIIKWGFPHFDYKGPVCSMAAFKQHCAFGFWKASLMKDPKGLFDEKTAMGHLGKIKSLKDLPSDKILSSYIKEAMKLNEEGIKISRVKKTKEEKILTVPPYFMNALNKNKKALAVFEKFSYSDRKEYVEWLTEAKTEETRNKRLATTLEWLAEGKSRLWKYK